MDSRTEQETNEGQAGTCTLQVSGGHEMHHSGTRPRPQGRNPTQDIHRHQGRLPNTPQRRQHQEKKNCPHTRTGNKQDWEWPRQRTAMCQKTQQSQPDRNKLLNTINTRYTGSTQTTTKSTTLKLADWMHPMKPEPTTHPDTGQYKTYWANKLPPPRSASKPAWTTYLEVCPLHVCTSSSWNTWPRQTSMNGLINVGQSQ